MSRICFVSWEIHPTTWGGCGVLLHHAAQRLLQAGHDILFLLDVKKKEFDRFNETDRLNFPNAEHCRAFHVEALCSDFPWSEQQIPNNFQYRDLRFAHAAHKLLRQEQIDFMEFFEYCGSGYYAFAKKLYERGPNSILGVRLHNSVELIDSFEATKPIDRERYGMYGLERGGIDFAEVILTPTQRYFDVHSRELYGIDPKHTVVSQSPREDFPFLRNGHEPERMLIVYLGRVHQFKNVEQLVKAGILFLSRHPEIQCDFELIGQDSAESPTTGRFGDYLRQMIPAPLRERFIFSGHLNHNIIAEHLKEATFGVFPNRFESFCYAVHEVYSAGVPVVVNDIPGFQDFFENEKNCLTYDGTTESLVQAMERMAGDADLRKRLSRPYPVAVNPLGQFYDAPQACSPLAPSSANDSPMRALVLVQDNERAHVTLESLRAQTCNNFDVLLMREAAGAEAESMYFLGNSVQFCALNGNALHPLDIRTHDALLILKGGDVLDPRWLELSLGAMQQRETLAFAGTWAWHGDQLFASDLDLAPEAYPIWHGAALTRAMMRTEPGKIVVDLFDQQLGSLGEIGYLWQAVQRWGRGCLYPEPLLRTEIEESEPPQGRYLTYLLTRYGHPFLQRLPLLAAMLQHDYFRKMQAFSGNGPTDESLRDKLFETDYEQAVKERMAESLGGLKLLKIVLKRWKTRKERIK